MFSANVEALQAQPLSKSAIYSCGTEPQQYPLSTIPIYIVLTTGYACTDCLHKKLETELHNFDRFNLEVLSFGWQESP